MKRFTIAVALVILGSAAALAQDWWQENTAEYPPISLELNAWLSKGTGNITWSGSEPGTPIDLREDAGMNDDEFGPYIRLNIGLDDRWTFRFSYWHTKSTGTNEIGKPIVFGDTTFPEDVETKTSLAVDAYYALAGYKFVDGEQLDFILMFGGAAFNTRMEMENETQQLQQSSVLASPAIGLGLDVALSKDLLFRTQIAGFAGDINHVNGQWFDAEGALNLTLIQGVYITGGYKLFRADADFGNDTASQNSADFKLQGPYFGLGLVF